MCEENGNKENKLVLIVIVREYVIFVCILFVDIERRWVVRWCKCKLINFVLIVKYVSFFFYV